MKLRLSILFAFALAAMGIAAPALAQDALLRNLQRKAEASEADDGFCRAAAARLGFVDDAALRQRIDGLLSHAAESAQPSFAAAMRQFPGSGPILACLYFRFGPAARRDGRKCRQTRVYACIDGRECSAKTDGSMCERQPGQWD